MTYHRSKEKLYEYNTANHLLRINKHLQYYQDNKYKTFFIINLLNSHYNDKIQRIKNPEIKNFIIKKRKENAQNQLKNQLKNQKFKEDKKIITTYIELKNINALNSQQKEE